MQDQAYASQIKPKATTIDEECNTKKPKWKTKKKVETLHENDEEKQSHNYKTKIKM